MVCLDFVFVSIFIMLGIYFAVIVISWHKIYSWILLLINADCALFALYPFSVNTTRLPCCPYDRVLKYLPFLLFANLAAANARKFIDNTCRIYEPPVDLAWYETSQTCFDASELVVNCDGEVIKDFLLYMLKNCDHHSDFSVSWV